LAPPSFLRSPTTTSSANKEFARYARLWLTASSKEHERAWPSSTLLIPVPAGPRPCEVSIIPPASPIDRESSPLLRGLSGSNMESQENGISIYQDNRPMSPPRATSQSSSCRPKRPPPITPKRFNRFFTPRSSSGRSSHSSHARRKLWDITRTAVNRKWSTSNSDRKDHAPKTPESTVQKRKLESSRPSSPFVSSSPCKRPRIDHPPDTDIPSSPPLPPIDEDDSLCEPDSPPFYSDDPEPTFPKPLRLLNGSRTTMRVLQRSFGGYDTLGRGWRTDYCGGL
jgi:hypothetical protein